MTRVVGDAADWRVHAARRAADVVRAGIVIVAGDRIANALAAAALGSAQAAVAAGRAVGFRRHSAARGAVAAPRVALVVGASDRSSSANAVVARIVVGAGVAIIASSAVRFRWIGTDAGLRIARARIVTLVTRRADNVST